MADGAKTSSVHGLEDALSLGLQLDGATFLMLQYRSVWRTLSLPVSSSGRLFTDTMMMIIFTRTNGVSSIELELSPLSPDPYNSSQPTAD